MTSQNQDDNGLDALLKRALADDLPAGVEAGMRARIDRFRADTMKDETRAAGRTWLSRRLAWAVMSVLMFVSGCLLQGIGARNPLADRIALVKTGLSSFESTRQPGDTPEVRATAPERKPVRTPQDKEN
jgi:hypothetical protein